MNKDFKNLKKYFNENGLRFNLNEERIWNYIEEVFGRKRAEKLSNIFDDQYYNLNDEKVDVKYKFCNNFEEATTLMYFQSDWFLKNSQIILEDLLKVQPKTILELGCYTGIFCDYISKILKKSEVTGIDIEKNLIDFGKERFQNDNLNLIEVEYKNLSKINKKFEYIFTNFGLEGIPKSKFQTYKFRENNDYKSKFDYFSDFFSFLNTVSNNDTDFFCIARIPTLETILSMVDGAQIQGWNWITDDLEYINLNSENIPKLRFKKQPSKKMSLESFAEKTLKLKDNNQLKEILNYEIEIKDMILIGKDSYRYSDTNDELFYEIYKKGNLIKLFAWTTLGYTKYKSFKKKENLINFFQEEHGLIINPNIQ